jgi:hypothetical protein
MTTEEQKEANAAFATANAATNAATNATEINFVFLALLAMEVK